MKQRQANYELLRIVSMMMVITLHFLGKGELLQTLSGKLDACGYGAWIIEAFSVVAVNVYVLLSGYFLVETQFNPKKLLVLWMQILFYSLGVPLVLFLSGALPGEELYLDRILTWIFPVLREHYWFATAYMLLFVFSPLLGKAVKQLEKRQLEVVIGLLLLLYSVSKSVMPFDIAIDKGGYNDTWFICLYLVSAYIRLYGIPWLNSKKKSLIVYGISICGIFGLTQFYRMIYQETGKIEGFLSSPYQYNHILCLLAAVALFCFFGQLKWNQNGVSSRIICKISSTTFGIYLLHENEVIRNLWPAWFGAQEVTGVGTLLYYWIGAVAVVFTFGAAVDLIRQGIFIWIGRIVKTKTVNE